MHMVVCRLEQSTIKENYDIQFFSICMEWLTGNYLFVLCSLTDNIFV